jgi:hypothetical protein
MSELYLIAHKVSGEPAFDVATRIECPLCHGWTVSNAKSKDLICHECDSLGYWWIIHTSGHRAYPYWNESMDWYLSELCNVPPMPEGLPDHYLHSASPAETRSRLEALLAKLPPAPSTPFKRRF